MSKELPVYLKYKNKRNSDVFWYNYNRFLGKAISMFKWKNLPEEIDERYLELTLMQLGFVCFFKDETLDKYMCLQCTLGGRFNVYNIPTLYHIYTASGYNAERNKSNAVIIWNNFLHQSIVPLLSYHAYSISNVERTIEVNLNQLKRPYIFLVPENQRLTFLKLIEEIKDNQDVVIGDKNLDIDAVNIQSTITPNNTLDLYTLKKKYYNEALTDLGINNLQTDKKERLVSGEVSSNDEDVYINRYNMLEARKQACKQINDMFGLNIDVEFRYDEQLRMEQRQNVMIPNQQGNFVKPNEEGDSNE